MIPAVADYASLRPMRQPFKIHAQTTRGNVHDVANSFLNQAACRVITECRLPPISSQYLSMEAAACAASKTVGFDIDFQRLLKAYEKRGTLLRALYIHSADRGSGEFSADPPLDRLAGLQRIYGCFQKARQRSLTMAKADASSNAT